MLLRILSAVVGAPLFLYIVYLGGMPLVLLVAVLIVVSAYELRQMARKKTRIFFGFVAPASLLFALSVYTENPLYIIAVLGLLLPAAFLLLFIRGLPPDDIVRELELNVLSVLYLTLYGFLLLVRKLPDGFLLTLLSLLVIWGYDIGAYFAGISCGRVRPWQEISPKKSVEGVAGGIILSAAAALILAIFTHIPLTLVGLMAVFGAVFTQLGDFAESSLKRYFTVKDSGYIIPGHGGVLDRFDGLLFALPVIYLILITAY